MIKNGDCLIRSYPMPIALLLSLASCAPVISKQVREQVKPDTTFMAVLNNPERFQGQMVLLSGVIVDAKNTKEGTLLQVLQRPAGFRGQPKAVDKTEGRFLALDSRYLDVYVYAKGREVTVAGEVLGKRTLPLDTTEYTYPLIRVKELYLWPVIEKYYYDPYPYYFNNYWWWQNDLLFMHQHRYRKCK